MSCAILTFRRQVATSFSVCYKSAILKKLFSKMSFKPVTHVIFDLDGTLLDTEVVYSRVLSDMARAYGKEYSKEVRMKVLGTNEPDTAKTFISEFGLEGQLTAERFLKEYKELGIKALRGVDYMPGAERLIMHLHKHKIPFAIATSSSNDMVAIKTEHLKETFSLFHHKVMSSSDPEVKHGKPAPDIYLICAARFDPPANPECCLVFEDAPSGTKGAIAAGMQVIAIPDATTRRDLYPKETTLFLDSMENFKPEQFGLPAFS